MKLNFTSLLVLFEFAWMFFVLIFAKKHKDKKLIWIFFLSSLANLKSCAWSVFSDQQSWSVLEAVGWLWMNFWLRMIHAEVIFLIISNQKWISFRIKVIREFQVFLIIRFDSWSGLRYVINDMPSSSWCIWLRRDFRSALV